jgi:hypothetical protein
VKKLVFKSLLFIFLLLGFKSIVLAQDDSLSDPTKSLQCLITTDFYIVHLTSYQEPKKDADSKRHKFKPFCQELPEHGLSYLAVDFIDRDLRKMPIGMRVVEEVESPEGGEMTEGTIIAETPAQLYKTGVAQIQADFPKPGLYALIVMVGDDMFADKIRIPLRVGIDSLFTWTSLLPFLFLVVVALIGYGVYRFFMFRHNRKLRNEDSNI